MGSLVVNKAKVTPESAEALVKVCPFGAISYDGTSIDISSACKMCKLCVKKGGGLVDFVEEEVATVDKSAWRGVCVYVDHHEGDIHRVTYELIGKARELASPTKADTLLDLYCGAGSIGLSMASEAGEVIGVEIVESAVECARENAAANGINQAKFYTGDASDTEKLLLNAEAQLGKKLTPDVIILDPPRAGCDEALVNFVASLSPKRIVYISCNPKTLARDVARFIPLGYDAKEVTPVDMFPCTGHVESVVCLTRSDKAT